MHFDAGGDDVKRRKLDCAASAAVDNDVSVVPGKPSAACLQSREKIQAIDRDYTHYFAMDVGGEAGYDQFVYQHFNNLCVIGIAPSHRAITGGNKVVKVDFDVGRAGDKSDQKPCGKKKAGAKFLTAESRLCDLICQDGSKFRVRCCVRGNLLELNERLLTQPDLINSKPTTEGYVAILQARKEDEAALTKAFPILITEDQYQNLRAKENASK